MRIPTLSLILFPALLQLLQCTQLTSSLENLSKCQIPVKLVKICSCDQSSRGLIITCSGLNSTSDLVHLDPDVAKNVIKLDISGGSLPCLELEDLSTLTELEEVRVTDSQLREALCRKSKMQRNKSGPKLPHLISLDLSHNYLVKVDESLTALHKLHTINLSNNHISIIRPIFSAFKYLKSLDISHNKLSEDLNKHVVNELPSSLKLFDISGNPLPCTPTLSWLYTWSLSQPQSIQARLGLVECNIENSPTHQHSPLLTVMKYYSLKVNPHCPDKCSCHFYHFAAGIKISPTYTVIVNCSSQNLTTFPSLPQQTTVLDLSHNQLSQESYDMLDVVSQNYLEITSLILSHNNINYIGTKLLKMKLHRSFKADHNALTEIPYDFSLLLQKYDHNQISLGSNPWHCTCNAEITDSSLLEKVQDLMSVSCGAGSVPDSIVGRKLMDIDSSILCPRSEKAEEKERVLQAVCGVLAFLIVVTLSKLLYDYWNYTKRGKLPWIVYRMP